MVPGNPGLAQWKLYCSPPVAGEELVGPLPMTLTCRQGDVNVCGKAVGHVADHRKPASGVEQVSNGIADLRQLQSFNRTAGVTIKHTIIRKDIGVLLTFDQRSCWRDDDGRIRATLAA